MASMNYVQNQLEQMGLIVAVEGSFILAEDSLLDFERSHDGVRGISRWLAETRGEYEETLREMLEEGQDEEKSIEFAETQESIEETWSEDEERRHENAVEHNNMSDESPEAEEASYEPQEEEMTKKEFAPAPPVKEHRIDQLALAKEMNMSMKEIAQAAEIDDQDRGGVGADYIRDMKTSLPVNVVVLVQGQRFMAPDGWKIKESRPSGRILYYGSVLKDRKVKNEIRGAKFSLVRDL